MVFTSGFESGNTLMQTDSRDSLMAVIEIFSKSHGNKSFFLTVTMDTALLKEKPAPSFVPLLTTTNFSVRFLYWVTTCKKSHLYEKL